jgi:transposase
VMAARKKYPDELMDRGVRLVFESGRPIAHVARDLGVSAEALRKRVRRAEVDAGRREGLTTDEREELKRLRGEVFELRRANSILKVASMSRLGRYLRVSEWFGGGVGVAARVGSGSLWGVLSVVVGSCGALDRL